jgi:Na+-transporting methylmalonyl-CoA/oxaloacetate decarboxylase gamma subunit
LLTIFSVLSLLVFGVRCISRVRVLRVGMLVALI